MNQKPTAPEGSATLSPEMKEAFLDLACALSPENLSCDGELDPAQVKSKRHALLTRWRELEAQLGYNVSEDEVWRWEMDRVKGR